MPELTDNSENTNALPVESRPYCGPDPDIQCERDIDGERGTIYDCLPEETQRRLWHGLRGVEWEELRRAAIDVIGTKGLSGWFELASCNRKARGLANDGIDSEVRRAIRRAADDKRLSPSLEQLDALTEDFCSAYRPTEKDGIPYYPLCSLDDARKEAAYMAVDRGERLLVVSSATDLLGKSYREREALMEAGGAPVFTLASINQVHAWRGVGKSRFVRGAAKAWATAGEFLRWKAPRVFRVMLVEGETPGAELQQDIGQQIGECDNFFVITPEDQEDSVIPSIATAEGRKLIERALTSHSIEVLVLDSISTLANIPTNDEEQWLDILAWFKYLRNKYGIALFYLHHDGKGGLQRGSSKSEDLLDKSIQLLWEDGYSGNDGLRCIMKFDKARQPVRVGAHLKVELTADADGTLCWTCSEVGPKEKGAPEWLAQAIEMKNSGMSMQSIASELGVSKNKVWRNLNRKRTTAEDTLPF